MAISEVSRLKNELRIASCLAKLKREQAERAEEREKDVSRQLAEALAGKTEEEQDGD